MICDSALPLDGCAVGVTADRRGEEQAELLRRLGASVALGPVIHMVVLRDEVELESATANLIRQPPDVVLATTGIGIRSWIGAAQAWGTDAALVDALRRAEVWARGPKAQAALVQNGIETAYREPSERLDVMIDILLMRGALSGKRVALQLYGERVPWAVQRLERAGAIVIEVPVYAWTTPDDSQPAQKLVLGLIEGQLDAVTFTSPPAVHHLLAVADALGQRDALDRALDHDVVVSCVGPVTAEAALKLGLPVHASPGLGRLGLMVRSLTDVLRARHVHIASPSGDQLVVQGALITDGGPRRVTLSARERAVFRTLLRRPGAFVAKPTLVREAWRHDPRAEVAALDATVVRLRKRVAPLGLRVLARARRGYMLDAEYRPCAQPVLVGRPGDELD